MSFIKRIAKIFGVIIASILTVVLLAFAVIQMPTVQNKLIRFAEQKISSVIGLTVKVGKVSPVLWDGVALYDLCILDNQNDTIASSAYLAASVKSIDSDSSSFALSKVTLSQPKVYLAYDSAGVFNLEPLLQSLLSDDTTSNMRLSIDEIVIRKGRFSYEDMTEPISSEKGIDFSHIQVMDISAFISDLLVENGTYSASIQKLSAHEKSGFDLSYLYGNVLVSDSTIDCSDVTISTVDSKVYAKHFSLNYDDFSDFSDFCDKVVISANINRSSIALHDISYFASVMEQLPYRFTVYGDFEGTVSDFEASDIHIGYGKSTQFVGNVAAKGLPDIEKTNFTLQVQNLSTNSYDISHTRLPFQETESYVQLPNLLNAFSFYKFRGKVNGNLQDISLVGTLLSDAGAIDLDARVIQNENILCEGAVALNQFDCSYLLDGSDLVGQVSAGFDVSATFDSESFFLSPSSMISPFSS
ncbi:MAG: hypothetical protein MJ197_02165, partial [Bacteroidales bacterium]|nr:hypothetical protein [Bacteroidales bacterium]